MRHNYFLGLVLLLSALVSCQKNTAEPKEEAEFVPGELAIGTRETATVTQTCELLNSYNVSILSVSVPHYVSTLPLDSLKYVERILNTKPYINDGGWSAKVLQNSQNNTLFTNLRLMNMSLANQQDWLDTMQQLRLQEQPQLYTSYLLKVPIGEEKKWLAELQQQSVVRWAEPNYYVHIQLL